MDSLDQLRALVFDHPNPAESPHLPALLTAESLGAGRDAAPGGESASAKGPTGGVLWRTGAASMGTTLRSQPSPSAGLQITVRLRMAHVPTSIVHLLDAAQQPLVSIQIQNGRSTTARLRLRTVVEGYSAHAIETVHVPPAQPAFASSDSAGLGELGLRDRILRSDDAPTRTTASRREPALVPAHFQSPPSDGASLEVHQLPTFFPDRIAALSEICRATLHICIDELDGKIEQERTFPIWLLPRTSALLYVPDPATGTPQDLTRYLAAYVTPNAPGMADLLRRAAGQLPAGSVAGYQAGEKGVQDQVEAVYKTLREAGLTYVNSVLLSGVIPGVLAQRIRLPRESLAQRSANCIDGVVLFASLLEAASLSPAVVLLPGHALLAWEASAGSGAWDYLETSLISSAPFERARAHGRQLAQAYQDVAKTHPQKFRILPLRSLREQGIWPME